MAFRVGAKQRPAVGRQGRQRRGRERGDVIVSSQSAGHDVYWCNVKDVISPVRLGGWYIVLVPEAGKLLWVGEVANLISVRRRPPLPLKKHNLCAAEHGDILRVKKGWFQTPTSLVRPPLAPRSVPAVFSFALPCSIQERRWRKGLAPDELWETTKLFGTKALVNNVDICNLQRTPATLRISLLEILGCSRERANVVISIREAFV